MDDDVQQKVEQFFSQYKSHNYTKGQVLLLNGETLTHVFQLLSGKVKSYDVTYRGEEIILNLFKSPAFFPMSLAVNKSINNYIYEAETDIEVRLAPVDEVVAFVKANPDVLYDLLKRVYRGVEGIMGRMSHLMSSSAKARVMYELIIEGRRFGKADDKSTITLDINEKELGERAGLSRETVSREVRKLKEEKVIAVSKDGIVINNLALLEKKLNQTL